MLQCTPIRIGRIARGISRDCRREIDDDDRYTLFATPYGGRYVAFNSLVPRVPYLARLLFRSPMI